MRHSERLYTEPVLREMARLQPYTECLYAERTIYSFHSGIPMPPQLAVLPFKRFWAGEMSNERLGSELARTQPGLILLANDAREVPFQEWLVAEYRLVYMDGKHRLYARRDIAREAGPGMGF